jgi:hypothetical protein
MSIARFRRLFFVGLAALLALTSILPALAATPVQSTSVFPISGTTHCDGFDVIEEATVTFSQTMFFDNAGNPVRIVGHAVYNGTLTNSATGTIVAPKRGPQNFTIDLLDGTQVWRGIFFLLTVPGKGSIVHDVGRVTFYPDGSITFQGRHEFFPGDDAQMCAALAGV